MIRTFEEWKGIYCKPVDQEKLFQAICAHGADVVERVQKDIQLHERAEYGKFLRESMTNG